MRASTAVAVAVAAVLSVGAASANATQPAGARCAPPGDPKLLALNVPATTASAERVTASGRRVLETTQAFVDGRYWVSRCDARTGKAYKSMLVGTFPGPDGSKIRLPLLTETVNADGSVTGTAPTYASPSDPRWSKLASRPSVLRPTSEAALEAAGSRAARLRVAKRSLQILRRHIGPEHLPKWRGSATPTARTASTFAGKCQNYSYTLNGWHWPWNPSWNKSGYSWWKNPNGGWPNWGNAFYRVDDAHATWNNVSNTCGFAQITNYGDRGAGVDWNHSAQTLGDGWSVIDFGDPSYVGCSPASAVLGCARWTGTNGTLSECDMRVNPGFSWWDGAGTPAWNTYDLWGLVAHEVGHCLGLAHSNGDCGSNPTDDGQIMYCAINLGDGGANRNQGQGDWYGYHLIYGPGP